MRIHYDGAIFHKKMGRPFGGIARYFKNLIDGLPEECQALITLNDQWPPIYPERGNATTWQLSIRRMRPSVLAEFLQRQFSRNVGHFVRAEIDHPTAQYSLDGSPVRRGKRPLVVTVYDMIHELHPEHSVDRSGSFTKDKEFTLRQADVILAISETTRQDVHRIHGIPLERIKVTLLAGDMGLAPSRETHPPQYPAPYMLYVGDRFQAYKNFRVIPEALRAIGPKAWPCVAAGARFSDQEKRDYADLIAAGKLIEAGPVPDEALAVLYRDAAVMIYPSIYEGFGIPPLEAMQLGAPVIGSTGGSIPEVLGDAALLFEPANTDQLIAHIESLQASESARQELIRLGKERAAMFTWEKMVNQTVEAYRGVA